MQLDLFLSDSMNLKNKREQNDLSRKFINDYYEIKRKTFLTDELNIKYDIEQMKVKSVIKETVRFKFSKYKVFIEEEDEYDCEYPNLKKFNIDYSKYSMNEFVLFSFYMSVLLKFVYDRTDEYVYKRISISLNQVLKHFKMTRNEVIKLMLNDANSSILMNQIDILFKSDKITQKSDIIKVIRSMIAKFSEEKRGVKREKNLGDLISNISKINKEEEKNGKDRE